MQETIRPPSNTASLRFPLLSSPFYQSDKPKVVFMGDSVLDNFIWLKDPKSSLRAYMQKRCDEASPGSFESAFKEYQIVDLAMDETSSYDLLVRDRKVHPWGMYAEARRRVFSGAHAQYPVASDGNYYPVEILRRLKNVRYIFLSIGGNDIYLNADNQVQLGLSALPFQSFRAQRVADGLRGRLRVIVEEILAAAPGAALMPVVVYHPHNSFSISGLGAAPGCGPGLARMLQQSCLAGIVRPLALAALEMAARMQVPVVDLSNTFCRTNARHYGTEAIEDSNGFVEWSGAEPSNVSNEYMVNLMFEAMRRVPSAYPTATADIVGDTSAAGLNAEAAAAARRMAHALMKADAEGVPLPEPMHGEAAVTAYVRGGVVDASAQTQSRAAILADKGEKAPAGVQAVVLRGVIEDVAYVRTHVDVNDKKFRAKFAFGKYS